MICRCGKQYRNWTGVQKSIRCRCGVVLTLGVDVASVSRSEASPVEVPVCQHRSLVPTGTASCGCGSLYSCSLHGLYCSDRRPREELFTITLNLAGGGSVQLSDKSYRCCVDCGDNTTKLI